MRTNETKSWQRILSLVLTMAILLSFVPVTASAEDGMEHTAGVQVSSPAIEFVPAAEPLKQEGRYLLMSDAYGHIMSFDATAAPEVAPGEQHGTSYAGSIKLNASGDSENTYYMDGDKVILDNSDRHFALWNLRQYKEATGGTTRPNGSLLSASANTTFGGSAQYAGVELQKRTDHHDSYWYSKYFDDASVAGSDFQLRYFCFKSDSTAFKNHYRNSLQTTNNDVYGDQSGSRVKFILDSLGDGTFLLYFRESSTDYRVVTCDASGKWDVIRYKGSDAVSRMKADLNKLKLRLYEYRETAGHKSAAFAGQLKYPVAKNTALDTILTQISSGITVFDPTHRNQHIPYNGTEVTVTNIGGTQYSVGTKAGYYWLDGSAVDTATPGEYPVLVKFRNDDGTDTTIGQVSVTVGSGYISGTTKSGFVTKNADVSTPVKVSSGAESAPATFRLNDKTVTITVGMLTDADGNRLDTSKAGEYTGLTLTYMGMTICEDFTLTVITGDHAMNYPEYDRPGSVEVYKDSTTSEEDFAKTGVANIELSATAEPVEKGIDLIFIVDLSSSMRYHVNNSQYACGPKYSTDGTLNKNIAKENGQDDLQYAYSDNYWKNTRMYALEESLKSMVKTLADSDTDVRIAIADFGDLDHYEFENAKLDATIGTPAGSKPYWDADLNDSGGLGFEFSNHVNFILGRDDTSYTGTGSYMSQPYWVDQTKHNTGYELNTNGAYRNYTGKQLPRIYTGSGKLNSDAFQNADDLNMNQIIEDMRMMNGKRLGTNYDVGLETAYRLAYAREQRNIAVGEARDLVCIFMSDGAAMQFNYFSGRSQTEAWSQCLIGETDEILEAQNVADKYVITSDPYDDSVNQNPYLQAMLKDLLGILKEGNLIIPTKENVKSTYPKLEAHMYNGTDFFEAMKAVGVDCDWELLWRIAYELYTHHNRGLTLADGSALVYHGAVATGKNVVEAVTMSMRKPSYDASGSQYRYQTLSPYYYFYNAEGKNWWAEALKGDNHKLYPVISKFAFRDSTEWGEDVDFYYGDVRNNFSGETTEGLALDGQDYVAGFRGLDLDLYTIGFSLGTENRIAYEEAAQVLEHLASGPAYHYEAASGESLIEVLKSISSTISTSATRAFFTDKMGDDYDLSTEQYVTDSQGNRRQVNAAPTIRVVEYALDRSKPVYDAIGHLIRYKRGEGTVRETITFGDLDSDGDTDAWSDQVYTIVTDGSGNQVKRYSDIWDEETGLISGKFVIYNANKYVDEHNNGSVELYLDDSGRRFILDAETFFWTIGMIGETEMVLEYQAYLTGSVEGKLSPYKTYYDTNEEATLSYVNYLGNHCELSADPPKFPWGDLARDYPDYPEPGSVKPNKIGTTTEEEFLQTGVANIQLSATGVPHEQGVDLIVVMDLSGSMEKGVDSNAYPQDYSQTRIAAMEQALKNMVKTLRDSGKDVRIAMSDFGDLDSHEFEGVIVDASNEKPFFDVDYNNSFRRSTSNALTNYSEFSNYLNFPMMTGDNDATAYTIANSKFNLSNPSYTGKVIPTVYTGSGQVNAGAFVPVQELDDAAMDAIIEKLDENVTKSYGTNYDLGLEYAYQLGHAVRRQNQSRGEDRKQVCIFLSDGAAMQYNYFSGRAVSSTWADWITGRADGIKSVDHSQFDDEIDALGSALLYLMKDGSLLRPEYARDSGRNIDGIRYFRYYPDKENATAEHFYTVMDGQGWDLDWEYLCEIAEANGLSLPDYESDPEGYWEKMKLPKFRELLVVDQDTALKTYTKEVKDEAGNTSTVVDYYVSKLKMPDSIRPETYKAKHGNGYTGKKTDFFAAYREYTGTELTYDQFARIAYANRQLLDDGGVSVGQHLQNLLTELRTTDGYETLSPYAYFYNEDGRNWWAEAIKGDPDKLYPVINKYALGAASPFAYNGDVENRFSGETTADLPLDEKDYISGFRGLGMDLYTISFSMASEDQISSTDAETVLRNIATGQNYFFAANSRDSLENVLNSIITTLSHTATRAWFQDTMGDDYDLSTRQTVVNADGEAVTVNAEPHIRVMEYPLTDGVRTGAPNIRETVCFDADPNGDGTTLKAWSDQVYTASVGADNQIVITYTDIWGDDGVIRGKYFYYNTNTQPVRIDLTGDGVADYTLPAETFLWVIGVIGRTEMVLEYQAYLTGSVEGTLKTNGVREYYDTNESAGLTYINYLGNSCTQAVESPRYPWITDIDGSLVNDKYVEATDDPNEFVLTLEALAQGNIRGLTNSAGAPLVLDQNAVLREVLTDYFVLNPDDQVDVQVYTAAYNGDGTYADRVEHTKDFTVKLLPEDSDRKDTIEVSGFNYIKESVSGIPRTVNGEDYFGSKLIVKVRIKTRDGFWGGNNVPTNEPATGVYDKNGVLAEDFPEPQVNVPIHVDVVTRDKTVYYGDQIDTDKDGWEGDELLQQITVGTQTGANGQIVNGSTVTVTTVTNPDGSTTTTFVPEESWMDDFASLDWADGSTTLESDLSSTQPDDYTYEVEGKPNSDGSRNNGENPGNIAGSSTEGDSASDTGHIFVKAPQLTFKDSVTDFGAPTAGYDYTGKDYVKTEWVFLEDKNTENAPAPTTGAPELVLTYTPENSATQFAGDTRVEVTVRHADQPGLDIQSAADFRWEDCSHTEHGSCGEINTHKGSDQVHEFWVHTTVAILPDTVVIDYGLSVDIDPLVNDLQGVANVTRKLVGIGSDFQRSKDFTFGDARILDGNQLVRYSLHTANGMQMDREETFDYRGEYAISGKAVTAESTVTVIPATIIYYEDNFVNFSSWTKGESWAKDPASAWVTHAGHTEVQATDRPGTDQIGSDLNNRYGYDGAYTDESGYSMASYHEFTADATHSGEASFTFTGTAFDIIALSGDTTGTILVSVYDGDDTTKLLKSAMVDTYYGYRYDRENGEWIPTDPSDPNALYQVPVMKVDMEAYDRYYVVITVSYNSFFDHGQASAGSGKGGSYKFMLDAIRIYDQANDGKGNQLIENAYVADGEGWPSYIELRNILISANDFDSLGNGEVNGIVFIDGISALTDDSASGEQGGIFTDPDPDKQAAITDYANFGPNNELYLAKGQGVSFGLKLDGQNVQNIHLALKSVGGTAKVRVYGVDQSGSKTYALGSEDAAADISTATDLYYDITALRGSKAIVIVSSGDAILSVTNIKMTHTSADPAAQGQREQEIMLQRFQVSRDSAALALDSLTVEAVNPFVDVHEGDYYYSSVLWAAANGITSGTDATHFSPGAACSRAQVVMFLWRAAGSPEPKTDTHPFVDVHSDGYYYKAMLWAVEKGITAGVDETHFGPNEVCSRGQIVTFLWRAAGSPEPGMTEHPFTDVASGSYYHKAVLWAVETGITTGMAANSFCPAFTCTRGQVVTFLYGAYHK